VSEQHTYRENATDRHTKSVSNNDSMPQIKVNKSAKEDVGGQNRVKPSSKLDKEQLKTQSDALD